MKLKDFYFICSAVIGGSIVGMTIGAILYFIKDREEKMLRSMIEQIIKE